MGNPFAPWIDAGRTVVLDGGLGTELERRGHHNLGRLWSSALVESNPSALREVHRDFLAAGADVIATATYQASVPTLIECGHDRRNAARVLLDAVQLAIEERDAHGGTALVAASIGPFGAHLADGSEYTGSYNLSAEDIHAFQAERWHILADSSADILACETMPSMADVRAFVRLLDETPDRWAWISLMCRDATHLADGTPLPDVFAMLNDVPNLAAIGANCVPPNLAPAILDTFRSATSLLIMVYPNASNAWDMKMGQKLDELSPDEFAQESASWKTHGARIIGGCCKTTPEHVRRLREAVDAPL